MSDSMLVKILVAEDPVVYTVDNVLTDEECQSIIEKLNLV